MATKEEAYAQLTERLGTLWATVMNASEAWRRNPKGQKDAAKNISFALNQTIGVFKNALKDETLRDIQAKRRLADTIEALDALLDATTPGSFGDAIELREAFKMALSKLLTKILQETPVKTTTANLLEKVAA